MRKPPYELPAPGRRRTGLIIALIVLVILLAGARAIAGYIIEYKWWSEMGQVPTWIDMLLYSLGPRVIGVVIAFAVLFTAHARSLKFAGERLGRYPGYARLSTAVLLLIAIVIAAAAIDPWTVMRFFGARGLPAEAKAWQDPVFQHPLRFYLFDLPFWSLLLSYALAVVVVSAIVYWLAGRLWQLRGRWPQFQSEGTIGIDPRVFLRGGLGSHFLRGLAAVFLLALGVQFFLGRYAMLLSDHRFMVGIDYVDEGLRLPLQWVTIGTCIIAAALVLFGRWRWVLLVPAALLLRGIIPAIVTGVYVRPNEISIERPYIQRHIQATRAAFALDTHVKEVDYKAKLQTQFDPASAQYQSILSNVRLWDWRAFHDTITQIQALRPYYSFADTDVDRYTIEGQLRQVLLAPRELDIRLLPEAARNRWPNTHFIYTHGYGLVVAEANRITENGLPVLLIQDAPPTVQTKDLKLTRPELYYSEVTHEPIFVHTGQDEFDYPAGDKNQKTKYQGRGGFPVSSFGMKFAAALAQGDFNILLTEYLTPESRMMIRRNVRERVSTLAGFLTWETDPYLVLTDTGRLVWTIDGYTTSDVHPYSRSVALENVGEVNYMRNAVKATVDAYDGTTQIYIFDASDPIIRAYQALFPRLFRPFSEMPAQLRTHARYPEIFFRVQAEVYRTYHMLDPQAFYNNEDLWDVARTSRTQGQQAEPMTPTYLVASLPGEERAEFLLVLPFTPRNKNNLIGLMVARCDGEHLGETVVLQLSKQALIYGPIQIEARINQDQQISKDLTLWNQQGSQVVRGQILVLPIADTFIYVQPIYIQASAGGMPQLKKVALAMGDLLVYTDTWDQALAALGAAMRGAAAPLPLEGGRQKAEGGRPAAQAPTAATADVQRRLDSIREHLRRYRDLAAQGKWAEAGKELEAIEREAR